jgi:1-acyl-sn-glycerol-3-phosphate acyltransferase
MHRTVFTTPFVGGALQVIGATYLRIIGWRLDGAPPDLPKFVTVVAPHTSNWDFVIGLAFALKLRLNAFWIGKHTLFRGPVGPILRWLGGIPVDRSAAQNTVGQAVKAFRESESLVIALAPEGTRKKVEAWKLGFYHIAREAGVPIAPAFLDYARKAAGFGPTISVSDDMIADLGALQRFYEQVTGKRPDQAGTIT